MPAGEPGGGRWTSGAGGGSLADRDDTPPTGIVSTGTVSVRPTSAADLTQDRDRGEGVVLSDATPDPLRPGARYAQAENRYRVDLSEEEARGGHTIAGHVGKSKEHLLRTVQDYAWRADELGDDFEGVRVGAVPSVQAANKLVNSTLIQNSFAVDRVASAVTTTGFDMEPEKETGRTFCLLETEEQFQALSEFRRMLKRERAARNALRD